MSNNMNGSSVAGSRTRPRKLRAESVPSASDVGIETEGGAAISAGNANNFTLPTLPKDTADIKSTDSDDSICSESPALKQKLKKTKMNRCESDDEEESLDHHTRCEVVVCCLLSANAICNLLLDIVLEIFHIVPTRINHLFLTLLSAFMSFKSLSAISQDKFKFLHEDVQFMFFLELCLIFGDLYWWWVEDYDMFFMWIRAYFLVSSCLILLFAIYAMKKYNLWHLSYRGDHNYSLPSN